MHATKHGTPGLRSKSARLRRNRATRRNTTGHSGDRYVFLARCATRNTRPAAARHPAKHLRYLRSASVRAEIHDKTRAKNGHSGGGAAPTRAPRDGAREYLVHGAFFGTRHFLHKIGANGPPLKPRFGPFDTGQLPDNFPPYCPSLFSEPANAETRRDAVPTQSTRLPVENGLAPFRSPLLPR